MKKNVWFAVLVFVLTVVVCANAAVSTRDFYVGLWDLHNSFIEADGRELTSFGAEFGYDTTKVHRAENTVSVTYDTADEGNIVFFKTRDPDLVFPGGVKVGDSLDAVLQGGKIPGEMKKLDTADEGRQAHQWNTTGQDIFTVYSQEDTITELVFYSPGVKYYDGPDSYINVTRIDVTTLNYTK